ncbi:MAG: hypothetical protein AAF633_12075 [Chloroflexota bacterium]
MKVIWRGRFFYQVSFISLLLSAAAGVLLPIHASSQGLAGQAATQQIMCDGLVREAEDGALAGSFQTIADSRARGGGAINTPLETGRNPRVHYVDFCFTIETSGKYGMLANAYGPGTQHDSFFIQLNDFSTEDDEFGYVWDTSEGETYIESYVTRWLGPELKTHEQLFFDLERGQQIVRFRIREDGTHLDWLELVLFEAATPVPSPTPLPTATPTAEAPLDPGALFLPMIYEAPDIFPTPTPIPTATPTEPICLDRDQEPNNISRDVGEIPICKNVFVPGTVSLQDDQRDTYLLEHEAAGNLEILLTNIPAGNHLTLTLFDSKGNPVMTNGDETISKRIVISDLPPSSYFVVVYFNAGLSGAQPYTLQVIN